MIKKKLLIKSGFYNKEKIKKAVAQQQIRTKKAGF